MNIEAYNAEVGKFIKAHRKSLGMTQEDLAKKIGKSLSSVKKYELGLVQVPPMTVVDILHALGDPPFDMTYLANPETQSDPITVGDLFGKPATEKTLQRIADSLERIEMITTAELRILCAVFGIRNPFQQKSEENSTDLHAEFEKEGGNDDKILGGDNT